MSRRPHRGRLFGTALLASLAALASGTALAFFTTSGAGSAAAGISSIAAPAVSATATGTGVDMSWTAVTPPSSGAVRYSVSRDGGTPAGDCPGASAPTGVTACTDTGLTVGTHTYAVTARWRSWSSTGPPTSVKVLTEPATHLVLSAASSTPVAGAADNLTISARNASDAVVAGYAGAHALTFSGASPSPDGTSPTVVDRTGTAVAFGAATAIEFTAGFATVSASKNGLMRLYRQGTASLSVSDGTISTAAPLSVTVTPAAEASLSLVAAASTPTVGTADALTTTALDAYGNTATSYTGNHNLTFSGAAASPAGDAPTVGNRNGKAIAFGTATSLSFVSGVATASGASNGAMTLYRAGATSVTATAGSIATVAPAVVAVAAGSAAHLAFTALELSAGTTSSPCLFTCTVTKLGNGGTFSANVAVTDSLGNVVPDLVGGATVELAGPSKGTVEPKVLTIAASGPAESTERLIYTGKEKGNFTDTVTASSLTGNPYESATVKLSR